MSPIVMLAIEQSAVCLERASNGFFAIGREQPEGGDRDTTYALGDAYTMAANEVRMQMPAYRAVHERNKALINEWQRALQAGEQVNVPEVERWDFEAEYAAIRRATT